MLRRTAILVVLGLVLGAAPALAGKGGPQSTAAPAACTVSGNLVAATGLPTDQVVNFLVTTSSGTSGWVLGFTTDGIWSVNVPARTGPATYQFVSKIAGKDGSRYTVFSSCSA